MSTFRVLLARDKNTIYPQHLPHWARDAPHSVADTLLARVPATTYIDTRPALSEAQQDSEFALYYKADSHWNACGAWVGFKALVSEMAKTDPALGVLAAHPMRVTKVVDYLTGDLSALLRTAPACTTWICRPV